MEKLANTITRFKVPDLPPEHFAEIRRRNEEEAREEAQRELSRNLERAGIPPRYENASIESCAQPVIDFAKSLEDGGNGWLVLKGLNGRGKTYSAIAVLKAAIHAGRRGFYTKTKTILDEVSGTYSSNTKSEREVIGKYIGADVLVIDDLGKENTTDWSTPILFEIIDGRYERMRATIITTNLNAKQLTQHLSKGGSSLMAESVVSRIAESTSLLMDGKDRRLG